MCASCLGDKTNILKLSLDSPAKEYMATGFVLISVEPGAERQVYREVIKVKEVVDVHLLFGEYDLIARIEADDYDAIGEIVVNSMRKIPGVAATKTLARIQL